MKIKNQFFDESIMTLSVTQFDIDELNNLVESLLAKNILSSHQAVILSIQTDQLGVDELDILIEALAQYQLIVIGLKSTNADLLAFAKISNLAIFNQSSTSLKSNLDNDIQQGHTELPLISPRQLFSVDQIYAKNKDLVMLGNVKIGSEALSDKSIAIYAKAQGKLFAGINGDTNATIYVKDFQASLISIAGIYKAFDTVPASLCGKSVLVRLEQGVLNFNIDKE